MGTGEKIVIYFLKSFGFVSVFWLSWIFIFRPISLAHAEPQSVMSDAREKQQADTYSLQLQRVNDQLSNVDAQQKRMDAVLTQYEQHNKRYEVVLQKWEQQTGIRK